MLSIRRTRRSMLCVTKESCGGVTTVSLWPLRGSTDRCEHCAMFSSFLSSSVCMVCVCMCVCVCV